MKTIGIPFAIPFESLSRLKKIFTFCLLSHWRQYSHHHADRLHCLRILHLCGKMLSTYLKNSLNVPFISNFKGGLKAVVWTDVVQTFSMFGALILVAVKGTIDLGGADIVMKSAWNTGRLEAPM